MNARGVAGLGLGLVLIGCGPQPGTAPATPTSGPTETVTLDTPPPPPPPPVPQEALIVAPVSAPASVPPTPPPPTAAESTPRDVLGKTTTTVGDAQAEQARGGRATTGKITARDPIRIVGNAYVSIVGQSAVLKIKHAVDLFHAQNDRYPSDTREFLEQIIQANNIALPQLPYYQEYTYDPQTHALVVMEYPARKEARERGGNP